MSRRAVVVGNDNIPRCPFRLHQSKEGVNVQIHGFSDASQKAYAAVVNMRTKFTPSDVQVTYLMAKTRVAPLKNATISRLELMDAHCLAKLTHYAKESLTNCVTIDDVFLWTDSQVVLAWLAKPAAHWKTFVRNRAQSIHDLFPSNF